MPSADLTLLYRDAHLAVVDKPSGLSVHRGWDASDDTLAERLSLALGPERPRVFAVHRLDRGTSGVCVFALNAAAAAAVQAQLEASQVDKRYLALVRGHPPDEAHIDHPIPRREDGPRVDATSTLRTLARFHYVLPEPLRERHPAVRVPLPLAWVEVRPLTGRLHQVRRHCKHLGHPLIGDSNYGRLELNRALADALGLKRLALHAASLRLRHPASGEPLCFDAPLGGALKDAIAALSGQAA